jgi:tight adherence protein B
MIAISIAAIFVALFILVLMAWPGQRVRRSRLGIERKPVDVARSMNDFLERHGKRRGLAQALALAGISTDPGQFALRVLLASLLAGVLGLLIAPWLGLVGLVVPLLVSRTWVSHKGSKRRADFAEQLPDTLQMLIASLRSGFGLNQSLEVLTEDADQPARSELAQVMAETRMGRDLSDSLRSLSQRMDNSDLEWVVGAIDINRETGGNLAEILENVNGTIRERQRIGRKVRTYTAEGRLGAKIMVALPCLLFLLQWKTNPEGTSNFFSGLGLVALGVAVMLMFMGWLWIRKIASIKF